jgi:hypothetical protein
MDMRLCNVCGGLVFGSGAAHKCPALWEVWAVGCPDEKKSIRAREPDQAAESFVAHLDAETGMTAYGEASTMTVTVADLQGRERQFLVVGEIEPVYRATPLLGE